jgi:hypothetical protein
MSLTRREALAAAAVGSGLITATVRADEKAAPDSPRRDPALSSVPDAARKVFEDTFPGHRCIRMARRGLDQAAVYRGTFFNPAEWSSTSVRMVDGESVRTPPLFHLELDASGKVLEESPREIDPKRLPRAVQDAYQKWNPKGVEGKSGHFWQTQVERGKARVYWVTIHLSAVKGYVATFQEDGTVVKADPAIVP